MKIIYLDQNKWIDLAKAINKPKEYPKYQKVANLILEKVKKGDWVFPISSMHVSETTLREEPKSREKLVNTMVEISNAYSIKSFNDVQKDELLNAFFKILAPEKVKSIEAILKNPLTTIGAEKISIDIKNNIIPKEIKQEIINIVRKFVDENIDDKEILNMILKNLLKI